MRCKPPFQGYFLPTIRGDNPPGKLLPVILTAFRHRCGFKNFVHLLVIHAPPPCFSFFRSNFFSLALPANMRHETVVSEQPNTPAASAWFKPSYVVSTI